MTPLEKEWAGLSPSWKDRLSWISGSRDLQELSDFLRHEIETGAEIFPPVGQWLRVFHSVSFEDIRVVILGQDPYHGPGQATGIAFAVPNELQPKPPSLLNIFKEITADTGQRPDPHHSDLSGWADQGVFLLNTVLTVRAESPLSHRHKGWERVTDAVLSVLNERTNPLVFILWGGPAQKKKALLKNPQHLVLEAPHPSPLSSYRGFFGCRHFSQANAFLTGLGLSPIRWSSSSTAHQ